MFMKRHGRWIFSVVICLLLIGTILTRTTKAHVNSGDSRNIIFLIGDGMGVSFTSGYRYLKDNPATIELESTEFGAYLVGQQTTFPNDLKHNVTDSAASATAMATGVKTYNGAIGIGNDHSKLKSVLERAKKGKRERNRACCYRANYPWHPCRFWRPCFPSEKHGCDC